MHTEPSPGAKHSSPSLAALLSFVWPGLGQAYVGRRRTAILLAIPPLALLALAVWEVRSGLTVLAFKMVSPAYALTVVLAVTLVGVWRVGSMLHAFSVATYPGGGARSSRTGDRAALVLMLVAVVAMHGAGFYYGWSVYEFDSSLGQPLTPADGGGVATTDDPEASALPSGSYNPLPIESAQPPAANGRVTVLLTGVDFGPGRDHALNDTLLVVSIDRNTNKVAMVSVPRDTSGFPLYWGGTADPSFKINALVTYVQAGWIKSPDQPMTTLTKEIGYLIGIPVNYYATIDLTGFTQIVDMVGGVDVINPRAINDPLGHFSFPAGPLHLDGGQALRYVRSRYGAGDSDYTRSSRQQDVLVALERRVANPQMIFQLPSLLSVGKRTVRTNFPLDQVAQYAEVAQNIDSGSIAKCVLGPPYSFHPDSSSTNGIWTSRLDLEKVASLSVQFFGRDSRYYGQAQPAACGH